MSRCLFSCSRQLVRKFVICYDKEKERDETMDLEHRIRMAEGLTPLEAEIGSFILRNPMTAENASIIELADEIHVSKSAVYRFCRKIGLKGFNDLKVLLAKELTEKKENIEMIDVNYPFNREDGPQVIADKLLKLYETAVRDTNRCIDAMELQRAARMLHHASVIDIYTHAHNLNAAENFQDKMLTIGRTVNCPKSFYKQRSSALAADQSHGAIVLSYSGKATYIPPILKALYQKKIPVVLIGRYGSNLYPQYITHALYISGRENLRDRISQFSSYISMQYMMDVLFGCIYNMDREKNIEYLKNAIDFMDDRQVEEEDR